MTRYVRLPNVASGFETWTIKPSWIRVNSHLHTICWIEPNGKADDRFFVRSNKSNVIVLPYPMVPKEDSDNRAVVTCGRDEVVGFVHDPADDDFRMCSQCCLLIQRLVEGNVLRLWSEQIAEARIAGRAKKLKLKRDAMGEWAVLQFDPSNPNRCSKMAKEIEAASPNNGTKIVTSRFGELLGRPSVVLDESISPSVLKRINESADDLRSSLASGARKRLPLTETISPRFSLDREEV